MLVNKHGDARDSHVLPAVQLLLTPRAELLTERAVISDEGEGQALFGLPRRVLLRRVLADADNNGVPRGERLVQVAKPVVSLLCHSRLTSLNTLVRLQHTRSSCVVCFFLLLSHTLSDRLFFYAARPADPRARLLVGTTGRKFTALLCVFVLLLTP